MPNKALLVGMNNYEWIGGLRGCHNDLTNLRDVLIQYFDFAPENISLLVDKSATNERVRKRIGWLFDNHRHGDNLVLHVSGHGSYIRDFDGDEAERNLKDEVDELICLYDMDWRKRDSYLLDDDLAEITSHLPEGLKLTVVLDCCHSGTGTRHLSPPPDLGGPGVLPVNPAAFSMEFGQPGYGGGFGQPRYGGGGGGFGSPGPGGGFGSPKPLNRFADVPLDIRVRIDERQTPRVRRLGREREGAVLNHTLLAACKENQTAADAFMGGSYNGAFTYFLCKSIRDASGSLSYTDLIQRVRRSLQYEGFSQIAQLEGMGTANPVFR